MSTSTNKSTQTGNNAGNAVKNAIQTIQDAADTIRDNTNAFADRALARDASHSPDHNHLATHTPQTQPHHSDAGLPDDHVAHADAAHDPHRSEKALYDHAEHGVGQGQEQGGRGLARTMEGEERAGMGGVYEGGRPR